MLSFGKILLLVLLGAAVWLGVIIYKRSMRKRELAENAAAKPHGALETVKCAICGSYRPIAGGERCGRADCPVS